jgi:hypothetical protein
MLCTDTGTLYLLVPVNIIQGSNINIVTLIGVPPVLSDFLVLESMRQYGSPLSIYRGFHGVGTRIDNGKRYIVFDGSLTTNIPYIVHLDEFVVFVKYIGQPTTCFKCNSPSHSQFMCLSTIQTGDVYISGDKIKANQPQPHLSMDTCDVGVGTENVCFESIAIGTDSTNLSTIDV